MCILIVKPSGASVPSIETFKNCFDNNKDGAGMMIAYNGKVVADKGLMSFEAFTEMLDSYKEMYGELKERTMVFHFRIGTSGTISRGNTHPFPLTYPNSYENMKSLHWVADQGFAHNGIMSQYSCHKDVKKYDVSDTMVFGMHIASLIASVSPIAHNADSQFILSRTFYSGKFVFLNGDGSFCKMGEFIAKDGVYYSNSTYKKQKSTKKDSAKNESNKSNKDYCTNDNVYDSRQEENEYKAREIRAKDLGISMVYIDTSLFLDPESYEYNDYMDGKEFAAYETAVSSNGCIYEWSRVFDDWCLVAHYKYFVLYNYEWEAVVYEFDESSDIKDRWY